MPNDTTKQPPVPAAPDHQQSARTDDLLASGADAKDGARGFDSKADPQALQTGMEGIAGATSDWRNQQSESHNRAGTSETIPDNPGQLRAQQKS